MSAWGLFAGIMVVSPCFNVIGLPAIVTSAVPSKMITIASKGAVCSLKPCLWSKAKSVTVPTFLSINVRLTTEPP